MQSLTDFLKLAMSSTLAPDVLSPPTWGLLASRTATPLGASGSFDASVRHLARVVFESTSVAPGLSRCILGVEHPATQEAIAIHRSLDRGVERNPCRPSAPVADGKLFIEDRRFSSQELKPRAG